MFNIPPWVIDEEKKRKRPKEEVRPQPTIEVPEPPAEPPKKQQVIVEF